MWAKDEGDLIRETIEDALKHVDSLMIADDGSTDDTWKIIQDCKERFPQIEHIQQIPNKKDKGQREALLSIVKKRYQPDDVWVQVIEADVFLMETDVRALTANCSQVGISWQTLNAVRKPGTWAEVDTYPKWTMPIRELMPYAHLMEVMLYTFRPLPDLHYDAATWRPWPAGFGRYVNGPLKIHHKDEDSPLVLHVGYRGPKHFHQKYKSMGKVHQKYKNWRLTSVAEVERTVPFFNGQWNRRAFPATRKEWIRWVKSRRP